MADGGRVPTMADGGRRTADGRHGGTQVSRTHQPNAWTKPSPVIQGHPSAVRRPPSALFSAGRPPAA
jgi:hypothetical protein